MRNVTGRPDCRAANEEIALRPKCTKFESQSEGYKVWWHRRDIRVDGEQNDGKKMRKIVAVLFAAAIVAVALCAPEDHMYTTKYDNLDVEAVIKSERLVKGYVGCLLEEKPCTADGMELKKNLPDALTNGCASCSEAQKNIADKLAHHLIDQEPEEWTRLEAKYDPTGAYKKLYLENKTEAP